MIRTNCSVSLPSSESNKVKRAFQIGSFADLIAHHKTKASLEYAGAPFSTISPQRRGLLLEDIGKAIDQYATAPPNKEARRSRASYDWFRTESKQRVECKSAQLSWNKSGWVAHFKNIKVLEFDVLVLCLYTPVSLEYYECATSALTMLYSQGGLMPSGECLVLRAGKCRFDEATVTICNKLAKFAKSTASICLQG